MQLSTTRDFGTWQNSSTEGTCTRPWSPAFFPYSDSDSRWNAPVLQYFAAWARQDTAAQQRALGCLEAAGLPKTSFEHFDTQPLRIVILGDSVDRNMVKEVCALLGEEERCPKYNHCHCRSKGLLIGNRFIPGSNFDGPWPSKWARFNDSLLVAVQEYLRNGMDDGVPFDAVVFNSGQWDLHRLDEYDPDQLDNVQLPRNFLDNWQRNISLMLRQVQDEAPAAVKMWRTVAAVEGPWEATNKTVMKWHRRPYILEQLASLNDAGRSVAAQHGFVLQDVDHWTRSLDYSLRLKDGNHPRPHVSLELFNRILLTYFWCSFGRTCA